MKTPIFRMLIVAVNKSSLWWVTSSNRQIAANSWGEEWGEGGFFKIKRGMNESGIEENILTVRAVLLYKYPDGVSSQINTKWFYWWFQENIVESKDAKVRLSVNHTRFQFNNIPTYIGVVSDVCMKCFYFLSIDLINHDALMKDTLRWTIGMTEHCESAAVICAWHRSKCLHYSDRETSQLFMRRRGKFVPVTRNFYNVKFFCYWHRARSSWLENV